jgi:DNA replication and repair protein RecF
LLLDDIFDKIDAHRAGALMEVLGQAQFGQVFISDTDRNRIPGLLDEAGVPYRSWWVDAHGVTAMEPKTSTAE